MYGSPFIAALVYLLTFGRRDVTALYRIPGGVTFLIIPRR